MIRYLAALLVVTVTVHAQGGPRSQALATQCLRLHLPDGQSVASSHYGAPPLVALDTVRIAPSRRPGQTRWRATPLDLNGSVLEQLVARMYSGASWWAIDPTGDSLRISFDNGLSGTTYAFATATVTDTIRGTAVERFDIGPSEETFTGIYAVRVRCPSPRS